MHHAQSTLLSIIIVLANLTGHSLTNNSHSIFPPTAMSYFTPLAGKWEGVLEYSDYQSGKRVKLKTLLEIKPVEDANLAEFSYLYDDFGKVMRSVDRHRIDMTTKQYCIGERQFEITESVPGKLILAGSGKDGNTIEPERLTITFGGDMLTILKETRKPLRFRHQYTFKRSPETSAVRQTFSPAQLAEDFSVFKRALNQLHPGLYRYNSPARLDKRFDQLEARLKSPTSDGEFFRLLAEFLSQIKCGHTYLNPLNQPKEVRARFLEGRTYLPFYFRLIDRKMIITGNLSSQKLSTGSEIISINGMSTDLIIDRLLTVTTADGANTTGTRLKSIELGIPRENTHQLFDIYFPLFFPVLDRVYSIEAVERSTNKRIKFQVTAMTRTERLAETQRLYRALPTYDDDWRFETQADHAAYLKVPHSLTWRLKKVDYQKFIAAAFAEMRAKKVGTLIIDWRGNDGGDEAVGMLVASYLSARPIDCYDRKTRYVKSTKVDDDLFKHITFYDEDLKQGLQKGLPSSQFRLSDNNLFRVLRDPPCQPLPLQANNFQGRAFVIADASNVSASFQFLRAVRDNKLATIVGQTSGGNLQGINGDSFALLSLPNSRFEIDIPLYFQDPGRVQPDAGILPDHLIKPSVDDIAAGMDAELNFILKSRE